MTEAPVTANSERSGICPEIKFAVMPALILFFYYQLGIFIAVPNKMVVMPASPPAAAGYILPAVYGRFLMSLSLRVIIVGGVLCARCPGSGMKCVFISRCGNVPVI